MQQRYWKTDVRRHIFWSKYAGFQNIAGFGRRYSPEVFISKSTAELKSGMTNFYSMMQPSYCTPITARFMELPLVEDVVLQNCLAELKFA